MSERTHRIGQLIGTVMAGKASVAEVAEDIDALYQQDALASTPDLERLRAEEAEDHTWDEDSPEVRASIDADFGVQELRADMEAAEEMAPRDDSEEALLNGGPGATDETPIGTHTRARRTRKAPGA